MKQRKYALDEIILLKLKDTVFLVCMCWVGDQRSRVACESHSYHKLTFIIDLCNKVESIVDLASQSQPSLKLERQIRDMFRILYVR